MAEVPVGGWRGARADGATGIDWNREGGLLRCARGAGLGEVIGERGAVGSGEVDSKAVGSGQSADCSRQWMGRGTAVREGRCLTATGTPVARMGCPRYGRVFVPCADLTIPSGARARLRSRRGGFAKYFFSMPRVGLDI